MHSNGSLLWSTINAFPQLSKGWDLKLYAAQLAAGIASEGSGPAGACRYILGGRALA